MPRKIVDLENKPEVKKYLDRDVKAVELPEKQDEDYPPFILDGASGVGKTQQGFALLKEKQSLIYVVLTGSRSQQIYKEMSHLCHGFQLFTSACRECMETARKVARTDTDPFSTESLEDVLTGNLLQPMLEWMANALLSFSGEDAFFVGHDEDVSTFGCDRFLNEFADRILFLDEALPSKGSSSEDKELLRFVRNCGRMLKMRVVPTGTAAVIANMFEYTMLEASRRDPLKSYRWAVCHFLWSPMKKEEIMKIALLRPYATKMQVDEEELLDVLLQERPLLVHHFFLEEEEDEVDICDLLKEVGRSLCDQKGMLVRSYGLRTMWLCGSWLADKETWAVSPQKIRPPELVRGHFFEPAMVALGNGMPRLQSGIEQLSNVSGPLTASVYHIEAKDTENEKDPLWVLAAEYHEGAGKRKVAAAANDFNSVKDALSSCVQQCLAREPLLAVALSFHHRFGKDDFKEGIGDCFQTSHSEYSLGNLSGEQLELISFAALQLANGNDIHKLSNVPEFCKKLVDYLSPNAVDEQNKAKDSIVAALMIPEISYPPKKHKEKDTKYGNPIAFSYAEELRMKKNAAIRAANAKKPEGKKEPEDHSDIPEVFEAKDLALATKIPWLVPASSSKGLQSSLPGLRKLFKDKNVAALVPGSTNSSCDIDARKWPPNENNISEVLWRFEVKGRSTKYSMTDGIHDLIKKCEDDVCTSGLHHAMLIAVRGQWETDVCIWAVKKNDEQYLRVVLLLSGL